MAFAPVDDEEEEDEEDDEVELIAGEERRWWSFGDEESPIRVGDDAEAASSATAARPIPTSWRTYERLSRLTRRRLSSSFSASYDKELALPELNCERKDEKFLFLLLLLPLPLLFERALSLKRD